MVGRREAAITAGVMVTILAKAGHHYVFCDHKCALFQQRERKSPSETAKLLVLAVVRHKQRRAVMSGPLRCSNLSDLCLSRFRRHVSFCILATSAEFASLH
jgi:hypothetical protein